MARTVLTNADWKQLAPLFPKRGPATHRRKRLEGILWVHRTSAPWRDVPCCFGHWESVESCFSRWSKSGLWARIWEVLRARLGEDHEALYLDSTSVKAHRHSAGARGKGEEGVGRSRGGRGTKVHAVCDGLGYPLAMALTPAQEHDAPQAEGLLAGQAAGQVVADRGYDSDALRETIRTKGAELVIPGRKNRKVPVDYDKHCYGSRHVIENFFCRIKDHRRVATRYEKTAAKFAALGNVFRAFPHYHNIHASVTGPLMVALIEVGQAYNQAGRTDYGDLLYRTSSDRPWLLTPIKFAGETDDLEDTRDEFSAYCRIVTGR